MNGALTDMAMLNLVAVIFLVILVVSATVGIVLVNKGQHRKHFLKRVKDKRRIMHKRIGSTLCANCDYASFRMRLNLHKIIMNYHLYRNNLFKML